MRTRIKTLGFSLLLLAIFSFALHAQNHEASPISSLAARSLNFQFEQLTIQHGLPHNTVRCILQDSQSLLWFGTPNGLARYDGYGFKVYKHDPDDSTSISHSFVYSIFEDRAQTLWIGTEHGLSKFDRRTEKFTHFLANRNDSTGMSGRAIMAIHEDRSGNIWFGNWHGHRSPLGGLFKLKKQTGKIKRYCHDPHNPSSLSNNAVRFIEEDDAGNLWIGTQLHGLNRFDPKTEKFTRYLHDPKNTASISSDLVLYGLKDRDGNLWAATFGGGVNRYNPLMDSFTRYQHNPHNPNSLSDDTVTDIFQDSFGAIWISSGALSRFDPATQSFTHYRFAADQQNWDSGFAAWTICEDRSHNLWVGTRNNGAFKIDLKPQRFTHYRHDSKNINSLSADEIQQVFEDNRGMIWIATRQQGLSRFDPVTERFVHFKHNPANARSLSHDMVQTIYQDRSGGIWIGTRGGLNQFDPKKQSFTRYYHDPTNAHSVSPGTIMVILEDHRGALWIGTWGVDSGLNRFDRQTGKFYRFEPVDPTGDPFSSLKNIRDMIEDRNDNFWVASGSDLFLFDCATERFIHVDPPLNDDPTWSGLGFFVDSNGGIWGTHAGLCRLEADQKRFKRFRPRPNPNFNSAFDFAYNVGYTIHEDDSGNLWFGTVYGLHKFDPRQEQFVAHYYEKDGLPGNWVRKILRDESGKLWVLTEGGLAIFDEKAPTGRQFRSWGAAEGVVNSFLSSSAFMKTRRGKIYWGGNNGVYRFYPEITATNPELPAIRLTEFRKFNKPVQLDTAIVALKTIHLRHDENFFSLAFSALDFTNSRQNQYAYKLEGLDPDWVEAGNKHEANYTHVPPGKYNFRVKGSNADGVWNETGASVQIIIAPPFWQTWWFRLAAVAAVIAVLAALYNYRVSKLLEIERTRLRIARDLHDDVGSSLSSIALTAEMLQKEIATDGVVIRQLARVHETAQKLSRNLKEIVWAIDPQRDKFDDLLLHVKETAEELLGQKGITYTFDLPPEELPQSLKMEFRRNLFLIYKEMLHNIVKHANASKVKIALTRTNGMLQLQVADNGKGIGEEKSGNGNGLKSMRARAGELNGQLEIDSQPERGTTVRLMVKIP
jgi:ligand-binding sensor domain-containing protein/signal transduction histidine kinase